MDKLRVIHFGSGGGKGVTRVLTDLAQGHAAGTRFEPLIIYRRKRGKELGEAFRKDLEAAGVPWREVCPRPKFRMLAELRTIIREFRPQVFVAHGYSEHIWGRMVALAEGVPVVVQVEHNHERYKWLHLRRSRALAARTGAIVTVSHSVGQYLAERGHPRALLRTIYNGVRLGRFATGAPTPLDAREPVVLMVARFGRQKDPATLIRAAAILRDRGTPVRVRIAGGGKKLHAWAARWLAWRLRLGGLVEFLGQRHDVPELLLRHRVFVLSTHFEGLPLSLIEAMAAGCAAIGSRVPGVEELIEPGKTGWLAGHRDAVALVDAITAALGPQGETCAAGARRYALEQFSLERMTQDYERLFEDLWAARRDAGMWDR
ncbi:MAG: glycosyltransferase [Opitutaceae bacterium]